MIIPSLTTYLRWLTGLMVLGAVASLTWCSYDYGRNSARIEIDRANEKAGANADKAERGVLHCPPGKWNREARKCGP